MKQKLSHLISMPKNSVNYLRIIERTRLLYNTSAELGAAVGFSVENGNGLVRKGGKSAFMKDAIFRELAYQTELRTSLNLENVLDAYMDADELMQKYGKLLRGKDVCRQLIRYAYADEQLSEPLAKIAPQIERQHIPLLVLMLTDALPLLSAKDGDVKDIAEDYRRAFSLLRGIVCSDINLHTLPALTEMETWASRHPEALCRIDLIDCVFLILEAYGDICTPDKRSHLNLEQQSKLIIPDFDGIWTEDEASTVFWHFEELTNGHYLRRYTLNSERHELTYIKYHLRCIDEGHSILAVVVHPHIIHSIVQQTPVPNEHLVYLDLVVEKDKMTFSPINVDSQWFGHKTLHRSQREEYFIQLLSDERYTQINRFPEDEYQFTQELAAITEDALFIFTDDNQYFRVPKSLHPQLPYVHFYEDIGLIRFQSATYLAFDCRSIYYEITTAEQREALGITLVRRIE